MNNILLIYASFGQGHKIAAVSLQKFLNVPCFDLLDFCPIFIRKIYSSGYIFITEHLPWVWRLLFTTTQNHWIRFCTTFVNRLIFASFYQYLRENNITVIVATHFFPVNILAIDKELFPVAIVSIVTDLRVHPLWVEKIVDRYIVAAEETKRDLVNYGISANKIVTGFISLREGFLSPCNEETLRAKFAIDQKMCLLFVSSSRGRFVYLEELLPELIKRYNVFIIYGRNKKLKQYLDTFQPAKSLKPFSLYAKMWELMTVCPIIVTKPGGLTVFEGLYKKRMFVFTHYIPGQEEENMKLLSQYGIGFFASSKDSLLQLLAHFEKQQEYFKRNYPLILKDIRCILNDTIVAAVHNKQQHL